MHPLINKLLEKAGIKGIEELKGDEKATYDKWQAVLSSGEVSVEGIKEFCERQVGVIEQKWRAFDCANRDRLVDQHTVYKAILEAITAPQSERENLEKYLQSLLT